MKRAILRVGAALDGSVALRRGLWVLALLAATGSVAHSIHSYNALDFRPVWGGVQSLLHGGHPYSDPGFVYPPSMCLLLAPLGLFSLSGAHAVFFVLNAGAIALGGWLSLRLFGARPSSPAGALLVIGLAAFQPVTETLANGNVNGIIFALQAGTLLAAARGRWWTAAALFGLGLALKPVVATLLILFLLNRRWRETLAVLAVPAVLSAAVIALNVHTADFFTKAVPYLLHGESSGLQAFNYSLVAAGPAFGVPAAVTAALRALVGLAGAALLVRRGRQAPRLDSPLFLAEATGIVLATTWVTFSWYPGYYALYLVPCFVSVVCRGAAMRAVLAWVAVAGVASAGLLRSESLPHALDTLGRFSPTVGELLVLATFAVALWPRRPAAA